MDNYLIEISKQLGIKLWLLIVIIAWSTFWKILALWKSARKSQPIWFIIIFFFNTIGILEILYIYALSEIKLNKKTKEKKDINEKNKKKKSKK